mmetsp:Transcript_9303/g.14058  ORF Transcript_9303/g.14058 Transcript_9303/m.14058 type:complete len:295 (-) Transcript_9303:169-1053(-)
MYTTIVENNIEPAHQEQGLIAEVLLLDRSQDILRLLVVESGFLSLKDIGRVLTCTSKSIANCLYSDANDLWTFLLKQRCSFDQETLSASKMSSKQIFHSTFEELKSRPPMLIRDLCYSPQDYIIIVNIRYCDDGRAYFSKAIPGRDIPEFFDHGHFSLSDFSCDQYNEDDTDDMQMNVYIHRIVDNNVICVFESEDVDWGDEKTLYFYSDGCLEMADLEYSHNLFELLDFDYHDGFDIYGEVELELCEKTGLCNISTIHFDVKIALVDGDNEDFPQNDDVTFAHFLENMYAWGK